MKNCYVSADQFWRKRLLLAMTLIVTAAAISLLLGSGPELFPLWNSNQVMNLTLFPGPSFSSSAAPKRQPWRAVSQEFLLSFEPNQGQTDPQVKFVARGRGYGLFLTANEAVLKLQRSRANPPRSTTKTSVVRMKLEGAKPDPDVMGAEQLPGRSNYILGNDPAKWLLNVPQYARVRYRQIYPGVDLVYYGKQGQLEYDFEVAPGADPKVVTFSFSGSENLVLDSQGNLVVGTDNGAVELHAPVAYQQVGAEKRSVSGRFVLSAGNRVSFAIGDYDRNRKLIIDPALSYSTYLGGAGDETSPAIAVDAGFNSYVAGTTTSSAFPGVSGKSFQLCLDTPPPNPSTCPSGLTATDAFVTKFDPNGALLFSTYLGGSGADVSAGITVDTGFNIFVAGMTNSTNFPTTPNAFESTPPTTAGNHVFVTELNPSGTALLYSTYLAGNGMDMAAGVATDNRSNVYVSGNTSSSNFPVTVNAFQRTFPPTAKGQFFFSKVDTALSGSSSLVYSTYLGGSTSPTGGQTLGGGIAVDTNGKVYLTGGTDFTDMPVLNASQSSLGGGLDAFVAKFDPAAAIGSQELYLTYLGGSGDDVGNGIAVDAAGNAYVTGRTASIGIPIPAGVKAFQSQLACSNPTGNVCPQPDAFVAKIGNPASGSSTYPVNYFSYLGGTGNDIGLAIAVDANQYAHVTGSTDSTDLPFVNPLPSGNVNAGLQDAFVAMIPTAGAMGATGGYLSYLGGLLNDSATGIAVDFNNATYVAGQTASTNFPTTMNAAQASYGGGMSDAFVSKLSPKTNLSLTVSATPNPAGLGNPVNFKYTITNTSPDIASNVIFVDVLPASGVATFTSATVAPGACAAAVSGSVTCALGTLGVGSTATDTATVVLTPITTTMPFSNSATVTANGSGATGAQATVAVADFTVSVPTSSQTVTAGNSATYQVSVGVPPGQTIAFPDNISLSCSAGLPTGTKCTFSTTPVTMSNTSAVTSTLTISTTARPVSTSWLRLGSRLLYAVFVLVSGFAFLGFGVGTIRRWRWQMWLSIALVVSLLFFQLACGSSSKAPPVTGGTPAGSYPITITGTSGSASHSAITTLVVQ